MRGSFGYEGVFCGRCAVIGVVVTRTVEHVVVVFLTTCVGGVGVAGFDAAA